MKKPTLKVMNDYCKAHEVEDVTLQLAEDCELKVTPSLSLQERLVFINRVADFCTTEYGEDLPEYLDLIFWTTVFQMMSNMPMPKAKNKETGEEFLDLQTMYKWICALPETFTNQVLYARNDYLWELKEDCYSKIASRCAYLHSVSGTVNTMQDTVSEFVAKLQQVESVNDEMLKQTEAAHQLAAVYRDNVVELPKDDIDGDIE